MRSPERKPRNGRRPERPLVRVHIHTADIWVRDNEEVRALPLPILAGIHDSCLKLKELTGDWPFTIGIAPLLMARLQVEIERDEKIQEEWPQTLRVRLRRDTGKPYWVLMDIPVVEMEQYPPDFCRVLGVDKSVVQRVGLEAFADRVTEVLAEEPREPVEGGIQ